MTHKINTTWIQDMQFESTNPSGTLAIDAAPEHGGNNNGLRPKALMLSALAGCSGLDVASLIKKMHLEVSSFHIETVGHLTDEEVQTYHRVEMHYHFKGENLNEEKLQRAVDLSTEKYCGVMQMFRKFATVEIHVYFNN